MRTTPVRTRAVAMLGVLAMLMVGLLAMPQTSAPAEAKTATPTVATPATKAKKIKRNTLIIRVKGQRLGKRAKIVIRGVKGKAKGYKRTVNVKRIRRLTGLKRGIYTVRARTIRKRTTRSKPVKKTLRLRVTNKQGNRATIIYKKAIAPTTTTPSTNEPATQRPGPPASTGSGPSLHAQMATTNCTPAYKGSAADETINVDVPANTTVVVCAGTGTDTININSIGSSTTSQLWIAFGAGQKTINWAAGNVQLNASPAGEPDFSDFLIVRPDASPDIVVSGSNTDEAAGVCGTNTQFKANSTGLEIVGASGSYIGWEKGTGTPSNTGNC